MHIKNIIISGFRSFREQSFPDGLSPHVNALIGKNGSGKSNFFAAVQFVLSEQYATLTANERRELFHAGNVSMTNILSTFVEIVFDNRDGRLVVPGRGDVAEVRIRRTLGYKIDEFRVNDRRFTATEVRQLLESAGFSSSNPYYIVEQGKIINIVNMSEKERYDLMKTIAGTNVYEERRKESEQILSEASSKLDHVDKLITELNNRLEELEQESTQLKDAQAADEQRRCLEHCIYHIELENIQEKLQKLEQEWTTKVSRLTEDEHTKESTEEEELKYKERLGELIVLLERLEVDKRHLEQEVSVVTQKAAVVELDAKDNKNVLSRDAKERKSLEKEQIQLQQTLESTVVENETKQKAYAMCEKEAAESLSKAEELQKRVNYLQERRNRGKLYKSKRERDEWIKKEIANNNAILTQFTEEQNVLKNTLASLQSEKEKCAMEIENLKNNAHADRSVGGNNNTASKATNINQQLQSALQQRDAWNEQRRRLWQSIHEQEGAVQHLDERRKNARFRLDRLMRQDIRQGLLSLHEVLDEMHDSALSAAVHGPVIDLITVEDNYHVATEVTAGNTLFHVVIDSFDASARLLDEMNRRRKPGRVAFLPLDTCKGQCRPIATSSTAAPLISKLHYDAKYETIMAELFGHTAVVASLESGMDVVRDSHCDAVTVDGDQLSWKGNITGGYVDRRNMKLLQYTEEKTAINALEDAKAKLQQQYQSVAEVEQKITEVLNELEVLRAQERAKEETAQEQLCGVRDAEERLRQVEREFANTQRAMRIVQHNMDEVHEIIAQLESERKEEFKPSWSLEDEQTLTQLNSELLESRKANVAVQTQLVQLATEVQLSEDTVSHIKKQLHLVAIRLRELGQSHEAMGSVNESQLAAERELAALNTRLRQLNKEIDSATKERQKLEMELERMTVRSLETNKDVEAKRQEVEEIQMQRQLLMQQRNESVDKLHKLGVVEAEAVQAYKAYSLGKLMHLLKSTNEKLSSFEHVNRRALEQHHTLTTTRNELQRQRDNVLNEHASIRDLLDHLEQQKDEAIQRTYKQIQYQFELVCKELIGDEACVAELQLVANSSSSDEMKNNNNASRSNAHTSFADMYSGVRIRVSFGLGAAVSDLEQLSGGQKSLVALALIFAIQRCDPAPFYLFDEIDAALDAEYRIAVARMIKRQSEESQFIVASFKTEMVEIADSVLGIFYHNKVSRIQIISREEGVALLRQAAIEDKRRARENVEQVIQIETVKKHYN